MSAPSKVNLKIYQGSTFTEVFRWESYLKEYRTITGISKTAPVEIISAAHGIPIGWRVKVTNVGGMREINSDSYVIVTDGDTDTVIINSINATGYTTYTSGGVLEFNSPESLAGITARMQVRQKITSDTVLLECTTENGYISINDTLKTISISVPDNVTAELSFKTAVYSMELISGSTVIPFITGNITLDTEVTR